MAGLIDELINAMEKQASDFDDLLGLALEKKTAIIENDTKCIENINALESIIVNRIAKFEKTRDSLMRDIAEVLNEPSDTFTIARLMERVEGQVFYDKIKETSYLIKKTANDLREANERNGVLINNSLTYIDYSLNVIRGAFEGDETRAQRTFFDAKQ